MKLIKVSSVNADLLAEMHKKCFSKNWDSKSFETLLSNKFNTAIMIADDAGKELAPMGFILYQQIEEEKDAEIITLCTLPKYRNIGVGKALINSIDASKIFLEVEDSNLAAINLYEGLGFEIEGTRNDYYGNGKNALVLSKLKNRADF